MGERGGNGYVRYCCDKTGKRGGWRHTRVISVVIHTYFNIMEVGIMWEPMHLWACTSEERNGHGRGVGIHKMLYTEAQMSRSIVTQYQRVSNVCGTLVVDTPGVGEDRLSIPLERTDHQYLVKTSKTWHWYWRLRFCCCITYYLKTRKFIGIFPLKNPCGPI